MEDVRNIKIWVSAQALSEMIKVGKMTLIDCRTLRELTSGMLPGAIWLEASKIDDYFPMQLPDLTAPVVVYCATGVRALRFQNELEDLGYKNVFVLNGGIQSWTEQNFSLVSASSSFLKYQRYAAQCSLPEIGQVGQEKISRSHVLVVGSGGIGSPLLLYLAGAGVGKITVIDSDQVDITNLHRQILFREPSVGMSKALVAGQELRKLNSEIEIVALDSRLNSENIEAMVADVDLIVDATDNFKSRYLINQAAVKFEKVLIHGSVLGYMGHCTVFWPGKACYRCLFEDSPPAELSWSCGESGVVGSVAGTIATMLATETLNIITKGKSSMVGRLLIFDGDSIALDSFDFEKRDNCPTCSLPKDQISYVNAGFKSDGCE